ncbi:MAG: extracellular solute-binding protein [Chloroflexota bacterium]
MILKTLLMLAVVCVMASCAYLPGNETPAPAVPAPVTPVVGTPAVSTPSFEIASPTPVARSSLIVWLPPEMASRTEAGAVVFSDQLLGFSMAHPDLALSVEQKPVGGQGGILNYLRTGKNAAPSILPDLIALPVSQLIAAADEGLIYPLEDLLEPAELDGLFPVAQTWVRHRDHVIAYPFALTGMPQLEYSSAITDTMPLQWSEFISATNRTLVLPTIGSSGAKLALQFYLQAGGSLTNEADQPMLEQAPLVAALELFRDGRQSGFIVPQSSNISTLNEGRLLMQTGATNFALSASDEFLYGRTEEISPGFAAIPGLTGPPPALVRGWAWAVTTVDPVKRALAVELIETLTTAENMGDWSFNSHILPAKADAFRQWPVTDSYVDFAQQELERAAAMSLSDTGPIMKALENAVFDVVSLSKTPQEAAAEAVGSLQP